MDIEKLCKLSCIDIDIGSISSKVTKDEILRDVNIILNCAKSLNVDNDIDSINDNEKVMLLSSLRDDIPTTTDSSSILINSQEKHKNFFAVPKRAKQELEE
jgi:Asp-tRNA(Asn)/Glu-tRNA(Gln) amidotransferase C subunit